MKKNLVRIVALLLVAMLALTLIPLGALAAEPQGNSRASIWVEEYVFNKNDVKLGDDDPVEEYRGYKEYYEGTTIKTSNYDEYIMIDGKRYDFDGFSSSFGDAYRKLDEYWEKNQPGDNATVEEWSAFYAKYDKYYDELWDNTSLSFSNKDIKIAAYPTAPDYNKFTSDEDYNKALEAYNKACNEWYYKYANILAGYTPHQHKLSYWISDGTTHWRNCLVCDEQFIYQTWCQDGDEDEVCNICGGHVPYHDVKVIESEGGKITVNRDTASHRMKITADVEPAAGYKLEKLHFFKIREDGSRQEVTRRKKDGQFYTTMPTYELEVSAEFVKN